MKWYHAVTLPVIAIAVPLLVFTAARPSGPAETGPASVPAAVEPSIERLERELRLVVAEDGNEVRFRVREQLARIEFPSDAVGVTSAVTGGIVIADDGAVVRDQSKFVVDLTGLKSDSERRDGYIQRRTLETEQYPTVEFVPTALTGLASPPPAAGEFAMTVTGDLTVRGVTRPVTWQVTASAVAGAYTGTARTAFTFDDFEMTKPRVASVLSVVDTIRLEYDFKLVSGH